MQSSERAPRPSPFVRSLRTLDPAIRGRIQGAIALLAKDPRPPAARALQSRSGLGVRIGDYLVSIRGAPQFTRGVADLTGDTDTRARYLSALRDADATGGYQPLLVFARSWLSTPGRQTARRPPSTGSTTP